MDNRTVRIMYLEDNLRKHFETASDLYDDAVWAARDMVLDGHDPDEIKDAAENISDEEEWMWGIIDGLNG